MIKFNFTYWKKQIVSLGSWFTKNTENISAKASLFLLHLNGLSLDVTRNVLHINHFSMFVSISHIGEFKIPLWNFCPILFKVEWPQDNQDLFTFLLQSVLFILSYFNFSFFVFFYLLLVLFTLFLYILLLLINGITFNIFHMSF